LSTWGVRVYNNEIATVGSRIEVPKGEPGGGYSSRVLKTALGAIKKGPKRRCDSDANDEEEEQ
jgi:hypothetical protein